MRINGFEGIGPEWLSSQWESFLLAFWRKMRFWREREADLLVHALWTNSLLSFLVFFPFLSVFVLIFFLSLLLCFSFHIVRCTICFFTLSTGHGKGLFIVPAVTSVLLFCPINRLCLAWVYLPTMLCDIEPLPDRGGLILSFCAPRPLLPRC